MKNNSDPIGQKPILTIRANLGNGHAIYCLVNFTWYSVNFNGEIITDVRWQCSSIECEKIARFMIP